MRLRCHKSLLAALEHPSTWAGFAGVLGTTGSQLDKPVSTACYLISAIFSLVAIVAKAPPDDATATPPTEGTPS